MSISVCVGDVGGNIKWVSSCGSVGLGVGVTSYVDATGAWVDRFPAARGVLTLRPLEDALPGGESLEGAVFFVSEGKAGKTSGFLSGK